MRRHPALRSLSSDHHARLVIARKARTAARESCRAQAVAWEEIKQRFVSELEGHFRREERGLLPVVSRALASAPRRRSRSIDQAPTQIDGDPNKIPLHHQITVVVT
jgi:hypothetical protein